MASKDVIELGSSSEDEPEPKRPKKTKPPPNAMVTIPRKNLNEAVNCKRALPIKTNCQKKIQLPGTSHSLQKINNGQVSIKPCQALNVPIRSIEQIQVKNVFSLVNLNKNRKMPLQTQVKRILPQKSVLVRNPMANIKKKIPTQISKTTPAIKLPPGITITKTNKDPNKRLKLNNASNRTLSPAAGPSVMAFKKIKLQKPKPVEVVNLDEDLSLEATPIARPQWYVRPEDQTSNTSMEETNNQEPKTMIEITIEDSPVKPKPKKTLDVEVEITIEDSPIKNHDKSEYAHTATGSDDDKELVKTPQSRKKLKYPSNVEKLETISEKEPAYCEIEIDINPLEHTTTDGLAHIESSQSQSGRTEDAANDAIEITDSPVKLKKVASVLTPKKKMKEITNNTVGENPTEEVSKPIQEKSGKFHPIYQSFIDLCLQLENSDDMKKIVEKKIINYYLQVSETFTQSEEFIEMISSKIDAIKACPERMYLFIKDVVDELKQQKKMGDVPFSSKQKQSVSEAMDSTEAEDSEDFKRRRHIRKLEKTLKKLYRAINKLEEEEVDFDDDADSVYILTERYKERIVRVHAKLCQLSNTKMPSEPRVAIEARSARGAFAARRLEQWVNRRVPLGAPLPFPDFHDVLRCVRQANADDSLGWSEADIMEEARDLFTRCGKKLQRRRQENEWRLAASRISSQSDPAEDSNELRKKLEENRNIAAMKEANLINKYADKQNQMKLEGEEIEDKEADESPDESGDEGQEEDNEDADLLKRREARKERIRRILKDKNSSANSDTEKDKKVQLKRKNETETEDLTLSTEKRKCTGDNAEEIQVLSDDSEGGSNVNHLKEKPLMVSDEASSLELSDSDSAVAISDIVDLSDETDTERDKVEMEVVSIENSTESEQEECEIRNNSSADEGITVPKAVEDTQFEKDFTENIVTVKSDENSVEQCLNKNVKINNNFKDYSVLVENSLHSNNENNTLQIYENPNLNSLNQDKRLQKECDNASNENKSNNEGISKENITLNTANDSNALDIQSDNGDKNIEKSGDETKSLNMDDITNLGITSSKTISEVDNSKKLKIIDSSIRANEIELSKKKNPEKCSGSNEDKKLKECESSETVITNNSPKEIKNDKHDSVLEESSARDINKNGNEKSKIESESAEIVITNDDTNNINNLKHDSVLEESSEKDMNKNENEKCETKSISAEIVITNNNTNNIKKLKDDSVLEESSAKDMNKNENEKCETESQSAEIVISNDDTNNLKK